MGGDLVVEILGLGARGVGLAEIFFAELFGGSFQGIIAGGFGCAARAADRLTDQRVGLTVYNLDDVLNGNIQEFVNALQFAENAEKLKEGTIA